MQRRDKPKPNRIGKILIDSVTGTVKDGITQAIWGKPYKELEEDLARRVSKKSRQLWITGRDKTNEIRFGKEEAEERRISNAQRWNERNRKNRVRFALLPACLIGALGGVLLGIGGPWQGLVGCFVLFLFSYHLLRTLFVSKENDNPYLRERDRPD